MQETDKEKEHMTYANKQTDLIKKKVSTNRMCSEVDKEIDSAEAKTQTTH